jgi:hypothetical protein
MKITLNLNVELAEAIENALAEVSLSGLGADANSEYEVVGTSFDDNAMTSLTIEVTLDVERVEGKFVGKDEIEGVFADNLSSLDDVGVSL